jgi:hypothetical protein
MNHLERYVHDIFMNGRLICMCYNSGNLYYVKSMLGNYWFDKRIRPHILQLTQVSMEDFFMENDLEHIRLIPRVNVRQVMIANHFEIYI